MLMNIANADEAIFMEAKSRYQAAITQLIELAKHMAECPWNGQIYTTQRYQGEQHQKKYAAIEAIFQD